MSRIFNPIGSATLACSSTTASVALPGTVTGLPKWTIRLYNSGAVPVFVALGGSSVTATTADMIIPPGVVEVFQPLEGVTHIAGITASSTATLYITRGEGE